MPHPIRTQIDNYIQLHKSEMRLLCIFLAFVLVWSQADTIRSFYVGFFDGFANAQQR